MKANPGSGRIWYLLATYAINIIVVQTGKLIFVRAEIAAPLNFAALFGRTPRTCLRPALIKLQTCVNSVPIKFNQCRRNGSCMPLLLFSQYIIQLNKLTIVFLTPLCHPLELTALNVILINLCLTKKLNIIGRPTPLVPETAVVVIFRPPVYGSNGRSYKMLVMLFFFNA